MCQVSSLFSPQTRHDKLKNGLKQFLGSSVRLFLSYFILAQTPRRNRIPIEHRERIVRAFEDEAEDYLLVADTLGVNRSMARGISARYITEGRVRETPRGGRNNVLVDDEKRQCLEDIINENCVLRFCATRFLSRHLRVRVRDFWPYHYRT